MQEANENPLNLQGVTDFRTIALQHFGENIKKRPADLFLDSACFADHAVKRDLQTMQLHLQMCQSFPGTLAGLEAIGRSANGLGPHGNPFQKRGNIRIIAAYILLLKSQVHTAHLWC